MKHSNFFILFAGLFSLFYVSLLFGQSPSVVADEINTTGSSDITLSAMQAATSTYSITYNGNRSTAGFVPRDRSRYTPGTIVTVKDNSGNLRRSGYYFLGWNTQASGDGTEYLPGDTILMGTANVTLYAHWTSTPHYSVTYYGNGSTGGTVPTDLNNYKQGTIVTVKDNDGNLRRSGYYFLGWNTQASGDGTEYLPGDTFSMATADVILYAHWTSTPHYSVTYNGNRSTSGTVPTDLNTYKQGTTVTASANTGNLLRSGYIFLGWNTQASGDGTNYAVGETFTMDTSNVTLYAHWTEILTYSVTYNGNNNTSGSAPRDWNKYLQGEKVIIKNISSTFRRSEYYFLGWNTQASGDGTEYLPGDTILMGTANVTLYAHWTSTPHYSVTYNGNKNTSGTVPTDQNTYKQGTTVTASANTGNLLRSGYIFLGWNTQASGDGTNFAVGETFTMGTENVTLYAHWTEIPTYSVTYNGNNNTSGSAPRDLNKYLQGAEVTLKDIGNTFRRSEYYFLGWNTQASGDGTEYLPGDTILMGTADVILYAHWTSSPAYSVTYDGNGNTGGAVPIDRLNYRAGARVTVKDNTSNLRRSGCHFVGWNTQANGDGTNYMPGETFTIGTENVTLFARWTSMPVYTITYRGNGNTGGSVPTDQLNYLQGSTVTVKDNTGALKRSGYYFLGWNTQASGDGTEYTSGETFTIGTEDVTLFAHWTSQKYTLTINSLLSKNDQTQSEKIRDTIVLPGDTIRITAASVEGCSFDRWKVTSGKATLIDSTKSTCGVILQNGNAEITAVVSCSTSVRYILQSSPSRFALSANGKLGTISFTIPRVNGHSTVPVSIRLFDIKGQLLGTVVDKEINPGEYTVSLGKREKMATTMVICKMESPGYRNVVMIMTK